MSQNQVEKAGFTPIDRFTLVYAAASSLVVLLSSGPLLSFPVLALAALIALLGPRIRRAGNWGAFAGEFYPVFLTLLLYNEVGWSNRAHGASYDSIVQSWEHAVFGGQPSLQWMILWPDPAISTVFHLSYMSYYLIVLGTPVALWISGRRGPARETIAMMMLTFYVCYMIFRLFPVAGPRYVFPLHESAALQTPVAAFAHKLVAGGSAWGTAFPSSHVAVAFMNAATAWRGWRALGAVVWVFAVMLSLGTVYGQFHYAIDAVAGAALAAVIYVLAMLREGRPGRRRT